MSLPVYANAEPGKAWVSGYNLTPSLPNFTEYGYLRLNQVNALFSRVRDAISGASGEILANIVDELSWPSATPGFFDTEGVPGLDGAGGATLDPQAVSDMATLVGTTRARHPGVPVSLYGAVNTSDGLASSFQSANAQLVAGGVLNQLSFGIISFQQQTGTLQSLTLAQWAAGQVALWDPLIAAWGPNVPRVWLVQYRYGDQLETRIPQDLWEQTLAFVAANAVPSRGDALLMYDGYFFNWDSRVDPPYWNAIPGIIGAVSVLGPGGANPVPAGNGAGRSLVLTTSALTLILDY